MKDLTPDEGLRRLDAAIARDFAILNHPPAPWTPELTGPDGQPALDALVVGAGMNGLGAAFALRRMGVFRLLHIDRRPAGLEGPWLTYARMETLRSPKTLTGPAQGIPNLAFRAWWEAQHGAEGWEALDYIVKEDWARYLAWFGEVTGAQVESRTELVSLTPAGRFLQARLRGPEGERLVHARQVVLATGREGQAAPRIPAAFAPWHGTRVLHSAEDIDFARWKGKRVAAIGLSASAFDNACAAAEAGAEAVVIGRAPALPTLNKSKGLGYAGFTYGFPALPLAARLSWLRHINRTRVAPPRHTVQRATAAGVRIVTGFETERVEDRDGALILKGPGGEIPADLVILGTGFHFDLTAAPELKGLAENALTYRDLGPEAAAEGEDEYLDCPVLGEGFQCLPRDGADPAGLSRLRIFTHAAQPTLGAVASDIPKCSEGAQALAEAISRDLFLEDAAAVHRPALEAYDEPELLGDEAPGTPYQS